MSRVWFITGAGRGLGAELVKAALDAGDKVVAASRNLTALGKIAGADRDELLSVELDVTEPAQVEAAVNAAMSRFGRIDVLVNNAGYGHLGFFEEMSMEDAIDQLSTNLFGVFNVCWAVLPVMRAARSGRVLNISSLGGLMGGELSALYCASKFGLEGFSDCLAAEMAPFGIAVTVVEPGPFRTEFLSMKSIKFNGNPIADYDTRRTQLREAFTSRDGAQPGDPRKLANAIVMLAHAVEPPRRFIAGSVAMRAVDARLDSVRAEMEGWHQLSAGTDYPTDGMNV